MLQHVWERASQARYLTDLIIATDDDKIRDAALSFKARVMMTRPDHPSGTDRVAEVASASDAQLIVNIQGDEPMIDPAAIDLAIYGLMDADGVVMGTLKKRIEFQPEIPIPYVREAGESTAYFKHVGLYVYRRDFLLEYPSLPVGPLEKAERLEQLRALENGHRIRVVETEYESLGVDTPQDWARVAALYEQVMART
jgi:3-deoxy-manno-octulosonate cytidylyltransferase (CMP-KDO synthetase)